MFIQTENTPNPSTLKFLPGREVMPSGTADFANTEAANRSPLAAKLFTVDGVASVFLGGDFITVGKTDAATWSTLKPLLLSAIMDFFSAGLLPVITESAEKAADGEETDLVRQIKELLDTRVRPAVAQDGGDIIFRSFEDGIVYVHLQGACSGCPSSTATLKHGIENMLKYYVPEVVAVQAVD
ncbi:NifU family protein [Magnetospirillum sulfuroxidans]|uniref:NifU family protein n=1 Tax=Magnetospirillum sulfuroxidans TaxID=611300 RepID=A0ABS5IFX3_9PROT|nr:NifU family protein [Magnetospirillum sulfuroxidans]MBR9972618.1 NifU family protein [Magnetospirillum sulfuroxidans]